MSRSFELADLEKMFSNPCALGDYLVMGTAFVENSGDEISEDLVTKALVLLQKRHPFFTAYLDLHKAENRMFIKINDEDEAKFESRIQLEWLDLTSDESFTRKKAIDESNRFDSTLFVYGPEHLLWKVQVISYKENDQTKYVINLVIHIAITDGLNITTLTIELVNILNALLTGKECDEMKNKMEPCEDLYVLSKKFNLFKEEHKQTIERLNNRELTKFNLDKKFRSYNESGFWLDLFKIDKDLTSRILASCKKNKVRLTGFFQTALFYALKELYDENGLDFPKKLLIELAASLRVRYQPVLDFANCRLQTVVVIFPVDENSFGEFKDFWKDAVYIHGLVQENTSADTGTLFSVSHSGQLDAFNQVFAEAESLNDVCNILTNEVLCDVAVSNLGTFVNDTVKVFPGPLDIKELYCTDPLNSAPAISPAVVIHKFFWRGEIMCEFGANKYSIGSAYIERFKELYLSTISKYLE
jgi:hypothetical protein